MLVEHNSQVYNGIRPHSCLAYEPSALKAALPSHLAPILVGVTLQVVQLQSAGHKIRRPSWFHAHDE